MGVTLKTIHQWRTDTWENTAIPSQSKVLTKGEPFYISGYPDYDILVIGDGVTTVGGLISGGSYFVKGKAAGYELPIATNGVLGGIKVGAGLKVGASGEVWANAESLLGDNLVIKTPDKTPGYEGMGKISVDLSNYVGKVKIIGELEVDKLVEAPIETGNLLELRRATSSVIGDTENAGIKIHNVSKVGSSVFLGVDKNEHPYFTDSSNNSSRIALINSSALNSKLLGVNANGYLQSTTLHPLVVKTRDNTSDEWISANLNLLDSEANTLELTIPKKLSDLEDYDSDLSGPSFVSSEDRETWNKVIVDVTYSSTITQPQLNPYLDGDNDHQARQLVLPRSDILTGEALEIDEDGKINMKQIEVVEDSPVALAAPTTITYISNLDIDEYGRVTKIYKQKINIQS